MEQFPFNCSATLLKRLNLGGFFIHYLLVSSQRLYF